VEKDAIEEVRDEAEKDAPSAGQQKTEADVHSRLHAVVVYEIIQREGIGELARGLPALWWSGLAAGLAIGFSVISEAYLAAYLPDVSWRPLVENLGYSVGFLLVILARQQLFTENTLTAVLPVMARWQGAWLFAMLRLWAIVLAANLVGCLIFAAFMLHANVLSDDVAREIVRIGEHLMAFAPGEMFLRGIAAGWLIATLVWMLPSSEGNEFVVITLITYLIALGDFTHVIAGSVEIFYLTLNGDIAIADGIFGFLLPTLAGNIFGGTVLFALLSYAQVREELDEMQDER